MDIVQGFGLRLILVEIWGISVRLVGCGGLRGYWLGCWLLNTSLNRLLSL